MKLAPHPIAGGRLPANYRLVLDIIEASGDGVHQSVHDIYLAARRKQPKLGFSTVYRALVRLRDEKLISEILIPGAPSAVYERKAAEHAHLYCVKCASIRDLAYHVPKTVVDRLAKEQMAEIRAVSFALHGICNACAGLSGEQTRQAAGRN